MPIVTQIICDECHTVKKETNHWYTLVADDHERLSLRPMAHTPPSLLQLGAGHVLYFCGRRCAMDGIGRWMDQLTCGRNDGADARQSVAPPHLGHADDHHREASPRACSVPASVTLLKDVA
jgi:hypothetical protein